MLNRRILRTKAFKALYSYSENPGMSLKDVEAALELSCESTRDLYLFLLSMIEPLTNIARERIEAAQSKFNPTLEELNPNLKFVNNKIATLLAQDPDFQKIITKKKFHPENYDVFLLNLYNRIKTKPYYIKYMDSKEDSLSEDALLFKNIFANELEDDKELEAILEDLSIYWNDDLGLSLFAVCKSMKEIAQSSRWNLPLLYQSDRLLREIKLGLRQNDGRTIESDHEFVVNLVRKAYYKFAEYYEKIAELTPKWTKDRLCTTDVVIISCGLAEAELYPKTPRTVILNEYIELSKCYSTPDSKVFVNGLLDKLIK